MSHSCVSCGFSLTEGKGPRCPICAAGDRNVAFAASESPPRDPTSGYLSGVYLPELDQATVSHLCRTALVILKLACDERPAEGTAANQAVKGAERILEVMKKRMAHFDEWWDALDEHAVPAEQRASVATWARVAQRDAYDSDINAWLEHGLYADFTLSAIEKTGAYLA